MIKSIPRLLIVDDEKNSRDGLQKALKFKFHIETSDNAISALQMVKDNDYDILLTDVKMPQVDGITFVKEVMNIKPQIVCLVMTAYGSIECAVEAMKVGVKDFITKPLDIDDVEQRLLLCLKKDESPKEKEVLHNFNFDLPIIGQSEKIQKTLMIAQRVAPTKTTVLLTGESGTGKEVFARAIHQLSPRKSKSFVAVHCQSFNENLIESELFGHEKGAFTNANQRHIGRFETADGGTLFLDEIGDIDMSTQVKLLRILETRTFERLGGKDSISVDIRLITATNKDLYAMVQAGTFREDLYYRLNVFNLHLPPLRERRQDIALLAQYFIDNSDFVGKVFSSQALDKLMKHYWQGNIRELKNIVEHCCILATNKIIEVEHLPPILQSSNFIPLALNIDNNEKELIIKALEETNYNKTKAAEILGINRRTLHRKLKQYNLEGE